MYLFVYLDAGLLPLLASRIVEVLSQGLLGWEGNFASPTEPSHILNKKAKMLMVREALKKNTIESVSMIIPPSDPPPFYCERLRLFFFAMFFGLLGLCCTL